MRNLSTREHKQITSSKEDLAGAEGNSDERGQKIYEGNSKNKSKIANSIEQGRNSS